MFSLAELSDQQTFIANLISGDNVCPTGFKNNSVLSFNTTGNILSINYYDTVFPEVFNNTGAEWRLVDTSGLVVNWTARFLPAGTVANSSNDGTIIFSIGDTQNGKIRLNFSFFPCELNSMSVSTVQVNGQLSIPANGNCATLINIAVDAAVSCYIMDELCKNSDC